MRVNAVPAMHRALLARCQPLGQRQGTLVSPDQRKARRDYENGVSTLAPI